MIQGAIFDLDGTLLDSMYIWDDIGEVYLRSIGYQPRADLSDTLRTMSLRQAACYCKSEYGLPLTVGEIADGVNRMVEKYYKYEVSLKPGIRELVERLYLSGVKMCVATATELDNAQAALKRCGILDRFLGILTCTSVGHGKDEPFIYREALRRLSTEKS